MCALLGTDQSPAKHVIDGLLETPTIATADLDHTDERAAKDDNRWYASVTCSSGTLETTYFRYLQ